MKVLLSNSQSSLQVSSHQVQLLVETVLDFKGISTDEVAVHFLENHAMCALHEKHFDDPSPTDCMSFPIDAPGEATNGPHTLGEIFVCPEVAIQYGHAHDIDPYDELSLYLIHGLLHLIGFDDLDPEEEKIMREEEKKCMSIIREKNALLAHEIAS